MRLATLRKYWHRVNSRRRWSYAAAAIVLAAVTLALATWVGYRPPPARLAAEADGTASPQYLDRNGQPLTVTFRHDWNLTDQKSLHDIPPLLRAAFIHAEDRRFFEHGGVDWRARAGALAQNLRNLRAVRGASTITEQVVRLWQPRPRTLWSRWLEGFEAGAFESRFAKAAILEFYLNQVPYARQRRGVAQAARDYFDRDLDTLNAKEMLALAVLVRAPTRFDPQRAPRVLDAAIARLGKRLDAAGLLTDADRAALAGPPFDLRRGELPPVASHFVQHLRSRGLAAGQARVATTLDAGLQARAQALLDGRVRDLAERGADDGAILVVDHVSNEVLVWVNAGAFSAERGSQIDLVTSPRQPGSTLKPFLYGLALERGWTAATIIDDSPLARPVGRGLHDVHNYSRQYYGPLRLRDALGNSLNVPAMRAAEFVGHDKLLARLRAAGFTSLTQHPDHYGDGLALGNGEVSLLELVQGYATLARGGIWRPLRLLRDEPISGEARRVYREEDATLIAHILSDPQARMLEFRGSLLQLPVQTAVKTGTSTDYRDAWAVGFNDRYTVGIWMGNLDRQPMREITGSTGPALVLRSVFAELNRHRETQALYLSASLQPLRICRVTGLRARPDCPSLTEWFLPKQSPAPVCQHKHGSHDTQSILAGNSPVKLLQPTPGLEIALDPRIPPAQQAFAFKLDTYAEPQKTEWLLNGKRIAVGKTGEREHLWPLARGTHLVQARVWLPGQKAVTTEEVRFVVK